MHHFIMFFYHFFHSLGLLGAFLSMLIENLGIPLPTEIGYLIARQIITENRNLYIPVLMILTLGHVVGAVISYGAGVMSDNFVIAKLSKSNKIKQIDQKLKKWYNQYGTLTVFLTRFVGYIRPWSSFVAGLAEVKFWPFLLWTALGSLIFNIICLYFSGILIAVWRRYESLHLVIATSMFLLFFAFMIYSIIKFIFSRKAETAE